MRHGHPDVAREVIRRRMTAVMVTVRETNSTRIMIRILVVAGPGLQAEARIHITMMVAEARGSVVTIRECLTITEVQETNRTMIITVAGTRADPAITREEANMVLHKVMIVTAMETIAGTQDVSKVATTSVDHLSMMMTGDTGTREESGEMTEVLQATGVLNTVQAGHITREWMMMKITEVAPTEAQETVEAHGITMMTVVDAVTVTNRLIV